MSDFLTVDEVAEKLRLSPSGVRRLCRQGRIPAVKIGRAYRIRQSDVERIIEEGTAPIELEGDRELKRTQMMP